MGRDKGVCGNITPPHAPFKRAAPKGRLSFCRVCIFSSVTHIGHFKARWRVSRLFPLYSYPNHSQRGFWAVCGCLTIVCFLWSIIAALPSPFFLLLSFPLPVIFPISYICYLGDRLSNNQSFSDLTPLSVYGIIIESQSIP